ANLPHFRAASVVVAAEPDPAMRRQLAAKLAGAPVPAELTGDAAEALHQPDASFDAVVFTQVLCTVTDPDRALAEARRGPRPGRGRGPPAPGAGRPPPALAPPRPRMPPRPRHRRGHRAGRLHDPAGGTVRPVPPLGPGQADVAGHRHTRHLRSVPRAAGRAC